jgi:hypothetical protein
MDFDLILRLEKKIDQLLERNLLLSEECRKLQAGERELLAEREHFRAELDRILAKLDQLDKESA